MTRNTLAIILVAVVVSGVAARQVQEIRVVTSDVVGGLPPGMGQGPAQPMGKGTGVIFGTATEADSNSPVAGALVSISIPGAQPIRVMADAQGRFGFRDLPRGRFSLSASRPGWVDGAYGRTRPGGPTLSLELQEGEKASGVTVPMWRFAAITGLVTDEAGEPIVNKPVRVLRRTIVGGKVRLVSGPQDMTDDRGMYRLGMLEPGDYVVAVPMQQDGMGIDIPIEVAAGREAAAREVMVMSAARTAVAGEAVWAGVAGVGGGDGMTEDGRPVAFPTVFYPNVPAAAKATIITVTSGEERAAVDFQLRPVPTVKSLRHGDGAGRPVRQSADHDGAGGSRRPVHPDREHRRSSPTDRAASRSTACRPASTCCAPCARRASRWPAARRPQSSRAATSWSCGRCPPPVQRRSRPIRRSGRKWHCPSVRATCRISPSVFAPASR